MRVLHVTPYFAEAWAYGGIPRVAATQVAELVRRGLEVTVVTTDVIDQRTRLPREGSRRFAESMRQANGVELVVCANVSNRLAYHQQLFQPMGLDRWMAANARRFDVAHLHACHNLLATKAAHHLAAARVPYVVQPNGTAGRIERRRIAKFIFDQIFGHHLLPKAAAVIAVTQVERRQLDRAGVPASKIAIVPNPLDLTEYDAPRDAAAFRSRWRLSDGKIVLYLGQVSPRKRVDLVVRSVAALRDRSTQLVIAGSDMGRGRSIRRLVQRLGLSDRTVFTGVLEGHERLEALAAADAVVYPTVDEIFGLVPLEAILCGTPVLVSDDCGCGEVVSRVGGGVVNKVGDLTALTSSLGEMLRNPGAWWAPVEAAARQARELFGAPAVGDRLTALYSELAAARRSSARR